MALPEVGLQAVIAGLPGFNAGAKAISQAYDNLEKKASNVEKATHVMGSAFSAVTAPLSSLGNQIVGLGDNVLRFGGIAGGIALAGVTALTAGIVALGGVALTETAKYERMSLSIQNLVAREISQGQVVEQQKQVLASLTKKESDELKKLSEGLDNEVNDRTVLGARIEEQKERIRQLTAQYGENGLVVIKERAELQGMELDYADLTREIEEHQARIDELGGKEGQLVTVMEKVRVGQISMSDAMKQAGPRAQDLLKWIQMLAIQSPFTQEGIADAFRTSIAYGFTTEKAQKLTTAMVDFTAATGKSEQAAGLIALALGQIQARGKLSAQELRQLSEQGVGVNKILEDMGFSLDDVTNGLVPVDDFIEAVVSDMEVFKGAAKEQSNTLAGLTGSLEDLKSIALREFFTSTFDAIRPYAADFVNWLTEASVQTGAIKELGTTLGNYVGEALKSIGKFIATIKAGGLAVFSKYLGAEGIPLWYELKELIGKISGELKGLNVKSLTSSFMTLGSKAIPLITKGLSFLNDHFEEFKAALMGIKTLIQGAVFASLAVKIMSLASPINLIITLAGLLGVAWSENWYGIQDTVLPIITQIGDALGRIQSAFQEGGLAGVFATISTEVNTAFSQISFGESGGLLENWAGQILANIPTVLTTVTSSIASFLSEQWPTIQASLIEWGNNFWSWAYDASVRAGEALMIVAAAIFTWASSPEAQTQMATIGQSLGTMIVTGIQSGGSNVDTLGLVILNIAAALASAATLVAGSLILVGGQLLAGIISGILEKATGAEWKVMTIAEFKALGNMIGQTDWKAVGSGLMAKITEGLTSMLAVIKKPFEEGVKAWKKVITETKWAELGINIIAGIVKGLKSKVNQVYEFLKEMAKEAIAQAMAVFGVESPSTVFADIGSNIILGLVQGLESGEALTQKAYDKAFGIDRAILSIKNLSALAIRETKKSYSSFIADSKAHLAQNLMLKVFRSNSDAILNATDRLEAFKAASRNAGVDFARILGSTWASTGERAMSAFLKAFDAKRAEAQSKFQKMLLDGAKKAIDVSSKMIDLAQEGVNRLKTDIDTLSRGLEQNLPEIMLGDQVLTAAEAHALLNQKLEEQKALQQDINELQENEAKLSFLQKQISLMEIATKAGLNIKDIFGGLQFGLDASLPDLITATNNIVQAMIEQINSDLQIASPSKVMSRIGQQTMAGFIQGMNSMRDNIVVPIAQTLTGNTTNQRVTNYNFDMTVNSVASPQAVIRQFEVARAMVG